MSEKKQKNRKSIIQGDEIDLIQLIKVFTAGRKTIIYSVLISIIIGLLIAFISPPKYTAVATLLPIEEKQNNSIGGLSALAGMAGVNLSSMMGQSNAIPADIYQQVVNSYPFLKELMNQKFHYQSYNEPITYYEYMIGDTIQSFGSKLAKYTIRLPWTLKNSLFPPKESERVENIEYGVLNLAKEEINVLKSMEDIIKIEVDKKTGLVMVYTVFNEPVLSAQILQKGIEILQEYVIRYKTKQARDNLEFVEQRFKEKESEYEKAQELLYNYMDSHRNIVSERADIEYQKLSDNYEIATSIYKSLAQQLEQAKIAVKEETPAFTILEPVRVPTKKSSPKKKLILVFSVISGIIIGGGIIFGKIILERIKESF